MSRKKVVAATLLLAGLGAAAATVAAQGMRHGGPGPGFGGGAGMGPMGPGMEDGMMPGRHGIFGGRSLTADEHDAKTRERFARLDKNGDGVLDLAEIEAGLAERQAGMMGRMHSRMRGGMAGQMGDRFIARFDTNKDGKVGKDEFLAEIRKIFAEMDLNNDGKIDDSDLPPMLRGRNVLSESGQGFGRMGGRGGAGPGGGLMGIIRGADANKDGVITLDEALAQATKEFDRLDRTKDNVVDKADFEAARKEMTDYRVKRFVHHYGADKDGKVSRDQFYAKAKERFARLDRNGDGRISGDEMPGWGGGSNGWGDRMRDRMRGMFGRGERGGMDAPPQASPPPAPKN